MNNQQLLAMSNKEFNELVTQAFTSYREGDMVALSTSPLAASSLTAPCFLEGEPITPAGRGRIMGSLLRWGVDTLKAGGEHSWTAYQWRNYNVLHGFYLYRREEYEERLTIERLAEQMGIAIQTFHNWRKTALELVSRRLKAELQTPQAIPQRQYYAFQDRYAAQSSSEQQLLRIAAIFRLPVPLELLHQLATEINEADIQRSIHNLVTAHLLTSHQQGTEFSVHPQIRAYLLPLLSPQERKTWHEAAAKHYQQQKVYLEAVYHFNKARLYGFAAQVVIQHRQEIINDHQVNELRALLEEIQQAKLREAILSRLNIIAGQVAELMNDLDGALKKYRYALSARDLHTKAEAYYRRAKIFELRNVDEAITHYNFGISLLEKSTRKESLLLARMYIDRAWIFIDRRADFARAEASLTRAESVITRENLAEWVDLHNTWSKLFWRKQELPRVLEHSLEAWLAANELSDLEKMIEIGHNVGVHYAELDQPQRALEYLYKSRELAIQTQNLKMVASCNSQIGTCYFELQEYNNAVSYYELAYEAHLESGNDHWRSYACYNLAEVYPLLGEKEQAEHYLDEGIRLAKKVGDEGVLEAFGVLQLQMSLNERQQKGLEYVKEHGQVANRVYKEVTGASTKQARTDLKQLVEKRVLKKVGAGRSLHYVLAG